MKKFLLSLNKSVFGPLDLLIIAVVFAGSARLYQQGEWANAWAWVIGFGLVWGLIHVIWWSIPNFTDQEVKDCRMNFLADEGLSLIKAGNTWGVMDGNRKMVGGLHDAPHQAVDAAMDIVMERQWEEAVRKEKTNG